MSSADAPRLLALHSEVGYVERLDRALPDEPEAVSESEQQEITRRVHREREQRDRADWVAARNAMRSALITLDVPIYATLAKDIRALRRIIDRIDGRLSA